MLLPGRTNSSTTFTNLTLADTGAYTVEVSGQCNAVTNSATLTVNTIPVVTGLTNQIVCPGTTVTLTAQVTGNGNYTYVWRRNGFVLTGQNTNTLVLANMNASKTGTYTLEVNSICRNVTNSVTVSLKTNVTVAAMLSQSQCEGRPVTFIANASGTGPFTYQWQKDGDDIAGASNSTYTIANVTLSDVGVYTVRVAGECSVTNASTTLNVSPLTTATPLQDVTVCEGEPVQLSTIVGGGGAPYQFVWRKNGVVLPNQTNSTLTIATALPTNSGFYTIEITGCGQVTNSALVTVKELLRASMETNKIACSCADMVLGPIITGTGPFTYVWRKDGVLLEGETNLALNLGKLVKTSPGVFTIEITGPCNSVTNSTTLQLFQEVSGQYFVHTPIVIPNLGAASPYPSQIFVQCAPASVSELTVNLVGLSHTFPDDIDIMLVAPDGRGVKLMSDAGGTSAFLLNGVDLTFSDVAATSLPNSGQITSGVYKPSDFSSSDESGGDVFPAPAPVANATTLGELISSNPNGYWSLYISDDVGFGSGSGSLAGGWNLSFSRLDYVFPNVSLSQPQLLPNGSFRMQLNGEPNRFYYLEASADLQQWDVIQTNFLQGISMPLTDSTAPQFNYRFYRISGCRE
jgi:subtilisin-like proprotein convertase family protein